MRTTIAGIAQTRWMWQGQRDAVAELWGWYKSASSHRDDYMKQEAALKQQAAVLKQQNEAVEKELAALRKDYDKLLERNIELNEELRQAALNEEANLAEVTEAEKDARLALSQAQHVNKLLATKLKETAQELKQEKAWVKPGGDRYYQVSDNTWWRRHSDGTMVKASPPDVLLEVDELKRRIEAAKDSLNGL